MSNSRNINAPMLYQYGETGITFSNRSNSGLMVNATEMARVYGKPLADGKTRKNKQETRFESGTGLDSEACM